MSGRPDPAAARWGGGGDVTGDQAAADGATGEGAFAPGSPAGGPDGGAEGTAGRPTEPRSIRGVAGSGTEAAAAAPILTDVAALTAERDDYLQSLQRLKADFDNYRKRVARLQEEQAARAAAALVQKLLPVLDNLDLAVAHLVRDEPATEDARALAQARDQLLDVLGKEGLERVDATEVPFDPTVHDAVAHAPAVSDEPSPSTGSRPSTPPTAGTSAGAGSSATGAAGAGNGAARAGDGAAPDEPSPGDAAGEAKSAGAHEVVVDGVMRAGYRWRGQVVRPAMVRVRG